MLSIISINEQDKWDSIVKSFENYDVFYLSSYAKAFQLTKAGIPLLLYYSDCSSRAINVIMKRDIATAACFNGKIPTNKFFDISSPYGYGGFLIEGDRQAGEIEKSYNVFCQSNGIISEFVRFQLFNNYQNHFQGTVESKMSNVVRTLDLPLDEIQREFEHKVRKNIKRAENSKLNVICDSAGKYLDQFLEIYHNTMRRTGAAESFFFPLEFFDRINQMNGNYIYFHAMLDKQIISTELVLFGKENCYSFLGGTNQDFFHFRPNDYLKYHIILWAKKMLLKRFILGGGYGEDDGIFKYKKSFAPNGIKPFFTGKKIFDQDAYNYLVSLRSSEASFKPESNYFPLYRS